jgi:hypothetical protein
LGAALLAVALTGSFLWALPDRVVLSPLSASDCANNGEQNQKKPGQASTKAEHESSIKNSTGTESGNHAANNETKYRYECLVAKYTGDLVSVTGLLAIVTAVLIVVGIFQGVAAFRSIEHMRFVERAHVSSGAVRVKDTNTFMITINNYGKTPAFIGIVTANIRLRSELPAKPEYPTGVFGGYMLQPNTPGFKTGLLCGWDGSSDNVIYGRVYYRDIFKKCYSCGFALEVSGPYQGLAVDGLEQYWEDRKEADVRPATA